MVPPGCVFPSSGADRAQLAMALEVLASPKPGNVDRCHDYAETRLEHFIVSALAARPALEAAEARAGGLGPLIEGAVAATACHAGGNTHFGAFILLVPLVYGGVARGRTRGGPRDDGRGRGRLLPSVRADAGPGRRD